MSAPPGNNPGGSGGKTSRALVGGTCPSGGTVLLGVTAGVLGTSRADPAKGSRSGLRTGVTDTESSPDAGKSRASGATARELDGC